MGGKKNIGFTITAAILGLMVAIQFRTVSEPVVRDTRDTWELREDLMKEKEIQSELLREIRANEEKLEKYKTEKQQSKENVLRATLDELKTEAGLTDISGPGIKLVLAPAFDGIGPTTEPYLSPDLLRKLINELNMYGATHISVGGERVINTTVIRDINRETKINGRSLNQFPLEINVIADSGETAEKLYNRMKVSKSVEDFFIDNLRVTIHRPAENILVPAYVDSIRVRSMEAVKQGKGEGG
ncbi:DUF881 domain-containing protein [Mesobacillus zeae]|uniref:DUF881 domain-containing protein n=1 Tax=Mesobacillus zeae TaxID=1917180 RepID=A0A398BKL5_9BACI|nr:DUF881 domain-containing protein [Mesobacillus zeae]RID87913.1 DUF881 domain-containing protein [Mesobacillus zeae]